MAKKVFIDPGHGGNDNGASGVNNLLEKNINLAVSKKVFNLLKVQGLDVLLSRDNDSTLSLDSRTNAANKWDADCYIAIHCNSFDGNSKGLETYSYTTKTNDLASYIHDEILKSKSYTQNRGVKTANFHVLRNSNMRSCLVELAFIDNELDAKLLKENQNEFAVAIARGICNYLGVKYDSSNPVPSEKSNVPVENSNTFYRVVCGSFNNRIYAEEMAESLKYKGYNDVFIDVFVKK
ncbi:MAG: N-acetylmuramoyl-L-alanine amidase [Paeniclostridium sordellii]|nr:N-acetylmuramoyl-L-alanine amidase [Paeniclostridium sordellii]